MRKYRKLSYMLDWDLKEGHLLGVNAAMDLRRELTVTCGRDTTVRIWENDKLEHTITTHADAVNDVCAISESLFITASSDFSVRLFSDKGEQKSVSFHHIDGVKKVRTIDNGLKCISASLSGEITGHDTACELACYSSAKVENRSGIFSLATSSNSIIAGCLGGKIYQIDFREKTPRHPIIDSAHEGTVRDLIFLEDKLISAGIDGDIRIWDLRAPKCSMHCVLHTDSVFSLALLDSNSNSTFLSGGRDGCVMATNIRTKESALILQLNYPIFHVNTSNLSERITICTSRSTVDIFEYSDVIPQQTQTKSDTFGILRSSVFSRALNKTTTSPTKIEKEVEETIGVFSPLLKIEEKKFQSRFLRTVQLDSKKKKNTWCSSKSSPRPNYDESFSSSSLKGSQNAAVDKVLLNDKRHLLVINEVGQISLWNILTLKLVHMFDRSNKKCPKNLKQAEALCDPETRCPSWCLVECRWGGVCVTLSCEEAFNAVSNSWEMSRKPNFNYSTNCDNEWYPWQNLSVFNLTRIERSNFRNVKVINHGNAVLNRIFKANRAKSRTSENNGTQIIVWNGVSSTLENYCAAYRHNSSEMSLRSETPSWVKQALSESNSLDNSKSVKIDLVPFKQVNNWPSFSVKFSKTKCVVSIIAEIAAQLRKKVKLPNAYEYRENVKEATNCKLLLGGEHEDEMTPEETALPEEYFELVAFPQAYKDSNGESDKSDSESEDITTSSFIGNSHERIVDPMMMIGHAVYMYKEKGKGTLRLQYRIRSF